MSKIKKQIKLVKKSSIIAFAFLVVALTPVINSSQNQVFADPYEQKINELNSNIDQNQKKIADLKTQGDTLANKLESARLETANLQSKIDANEAKNAQLKGQIVEAEAKITENKKILANSIRKLYIDGDISSLEILASSKSLSDYVDKQEYRDRVKNKIAT